MDLRTEIWRAIEGYENYQVSNLGRVRNRKGKILKPCVHERNGYLRVFLRKDNKVKQMRIHRLVAQTFIENDNPLEKDQVNHIDGNKENNCVDNLEWVSCKENRQHASKLGLCSGKSKIRRVKCIELNTIYSSAVKASEDTGVSPCSILDVCHNKFETMNGYHFKFVD